MRIHLSFATATNKSSVTKKTSYYTKRFRTSANDCCFHNGSRNLFKNTGEGKWFSIFLAILPKHVDNS